METPDLPPPLPTKQTSFNLPRSAWIVWGIYVVLRFILFFIRSSNPDAENISELLGELMASLLFPGVLAVIAFYVRKRSTTAGTWTFFITFGLMLTGALATFSNKLNARMALAQLDQRQKEAIASGDEKKKAEIATHTSEQLGKLAENASGQEQLAAKGTKAYVDQMLAVKKRYDSAVSALPQDQDFWRLAHLDDAQVIAKHREAIHAFAESNTALAELQDPNGAGLRREMERQGVAPEFVERTIDGYKRSGGARLGLLAVMRKTDAAIAQAMLDLLDLAEKNHGKWQKSADGKLVFSDDPLRSAYTAILESVKAANIEQTKAQAQLVAPQK